MSCGVLAVPVKALCPLLHRPGREALPVKALFSLLYRSGCEAPNSSLEGELTRVSQLSLVTCWMPSGALPSGRAEVYCGLASDPCLC